MPTATNAKAQGKMGTPSDKPHSGSRGSLVLGTIGEGGKIRTHYFTAIIAVVQELLYVVRCSSILVGATVRRYGKNGCGKGSEQGDNTELHCEMSGCSGQLIKERTERKGVQRN